jgi:P27 family predicted phage terminase small subunit
MAKRGRKPLPPEVRAPGKRIEGSARKVDGRPEAPSHLKGVALEKWHEMLGLLEEMGVLSRTDVDAIALYCSTFSQWRVCDDKLQTPEDYVIISPKGFQLNSPWVNMRNKFADQMARLLAEFGLTPSARSRVAARPPEEGDKLTAFLKAT